MNQLWGMAAKASFPTRVRRRVIQHIAGKILLPGGDQPEKGPLLYVDEHAQMRRAQWQDALGVTVRLGGDLFGVACLVGLSVPVLGVKPIAAQIATQVANVFVLPLVIGGIIYLVNQKQTMGPHRAGVLLNVGLAAAFVFSCVISYTGMIALMETFF